MFIRFVPPGLGVDAERAVAAALTTVDDLHRACVAEGVKLDGGETVVLVATPNDTMADVVRQVTSALTRARRVRVEAPKVA